MYNINRVGRKVFDELQLGTGVMNRKFTYLAGEITQAHTDANKRKSDAETTLVKEIVFANGRTIQYDYDNEERITKVIDSVVGTTEYTYDAVGQLLTEKVNGNTVNTMTYDNYGNIKKKNGITYTYNNYSTWKDLLVTVGTQTISYDGGGNPTSYLGKELKWEKGRQLKKFGDYTFAYNKDGIRIEKVATGVRHEYVLDGTNIIKEIVSGASQGYVNEYFYDLDGSVCGIKHKGEVFYFYKNLQGDVIAITDSTGAVKATYTYDAWGKWTITSDTSDCNIATVNPFRYRGYYYDTDIDLYYLQSRYYDPVVGRFINADSASVLYSRKKILNNLYAYCNNNPICYKDLTGGSGLIVIGGVALTGVQIAAIVLTVVVLLYALCPPFREQINSMVESLYLWLADISGYLGTVITEAVEDAKNGKKYRGNEVHHIVAQTAKRASWSRTVIRKYHIYTWHPANLVSISKTLHKHLHTNAY